MAGVPRRRRERRLGWIALASLVLHAAFLAWLARPVRPTVLAAGADLSLMPVELFRAERPRRKPARSAARTVQAAHATPGPVAAPASPAIPPSAPLVAAPAGAAAAPASPGPAMPDKLRAALRTGGGCTRAMSRDERQACEERLGRIGAATPSYDAPMDPAKRAYYDAVVAAGASGGTYGDPKPGAATPDADYFRVLNCSIKFGAGKKPKDRQGEVRLGRSPCSIPLQGSFVTPEASVRRR